MILFCALRLFVFSLRTLHFVLHHLHSVPHHRLLLVIVLMVVIEFLAELVHHVWRLDHDSSTMKTVHLVVGRSVLNHLKFLIIFIVVMVVHSFELGSINLSLFLPLLGLFLCFLHFVFWVILFTILVHVLLTTIFAHVDLIHAHIWVSLVHTLLAQELLV